MDGEGVPAVADRSDAYPESGAVEVVVDPFHQTSLVIPTGMRRSLSAPRRRLQSEWEGRKFAGSSARSSLFETGTAWSRLKASG